MWAERHISAALVAIGASIALACAAGEPLPLPSVASRPVPERAAAAAPWPEAPDYIEHVAYAAPSDEPFLLRWPANAMPLRVHLPTPPPNLVSDPDASREAVRLGVLAWTGVVAPGLPSFRFVGGAEQADVPIVWERRPRGRFIAACRYRIDVLRRRLGVSELMVTGRWRGGAETPLPQLEAAIAHEVGHALGLAGHSPDPRDVMYSHVTRWTRPRLSERDRNTLRALYARPVGGSVPASLSRP